MTFRAWGITFEIKFMFAATVALLLCIDRCGAVGPSLLSVGVHECGHLLGMALCGIAPDKISLSGCGILIDTHRWSGRCKSCVIAAMGPAANLLPALFLSSGTFKTAMLINGIFNLIPIQGTDGADILRCGLEVTFSKAKQIFTALNFIFAFTILLIGVQLFIKSLNPTLMAVAIYFMLIFLSSEK